MDLDKKTRCHTILDCIEKLVNHVEGSSNKDGFNVIHGAIEDLRGFYNEEKESFLQESNDFIKNGFKS